jgi:hypothetical protein
MARLEAERTLLHSHELTLPHPRKRGEEIAIVSPPPKDMETFLAARREGARS